MLKRIKISDLVQTCYPKEIAKLILTGVKEGKEKSKGYIEDRHTISICFIAKEDIINIDLQEEGCITIPMSISKKDAIAQAHSLQA